LADVELIETNFCLKSNLDKFIFLINGNELQLELGGLLYNTIRRHSVTCRI